MIYFSIYECKCIIKCRKQFIIKALHIKREEMDLYYFDHAASSPPFPEVVESVANTMQKYYANPSSLHKHGYEAEQLLGQARKVIASSLDIEEKELVFTGSGTESNNLAIRGVASKYQNRGRHIVTTKLEHASVYETCRDLEQDGYEVTYLEADERGIVQVEDVVNALREDTILVSIMHVNNEMGAIQPIEEIGTRLKDYPRILFHVDAVQSLGKLSIHPHDWHIDLFSASAHKVNGPRGVGLLYCRKGLKLRPLITGGGQEGGLRSGTEALPLIAGMAKAIRMTIQSQQSSSNHLRKLRQQLVQKIKAIPELYVTGSQEEASVAPHIVHFCMPGLRSEVVVHALEERGIYVSSRSACSSGDHKPSRVLQAMGMDVDFALSGIRVSLSAQHSEQDIIHLAKSINEVQTQLRRKKVEREG